MDKNKCNSCGEAPQKCSCKNKDFTKAVIEIDNPEQITLMRKVVIPASMGDDTTVPPVVGKYKNVLLYYEANQKSYLYSSDGIPTQLVNGMTDYEAAINLPQINNHTLIGNKTGAQLDLQDKLTAGANISIDSDNVISAVDTTYGPATETEIGLVKPGDGLSVDANGQLDVNVGDGLKVNTDNDVYAIKHVFDTVADMKASTDLVNGDYAKTLGFHTLNDGGGAMYKIVNTGTANEMDVISVGDLYANFVSPTFIKPEMIGAYGDGTHDDTNVLQYLLTTYDNIEIDKSHLITDTISATSNKVIRGNGTLILGGADFNLLYISGDNCLIDGLSFTNPNNYKPSDISIMPLGRAIWCVGNNNTVTNCKIDNYISGIIFGNNGAGKTQCRAIGNKITNLNGLSTGWVNDGIMSFSAHCIIKDNYVDVKTGDDYARAGICCDIHADYCVIENNYVNGNDNVTADIHVEQSVHCQILHNYCIKPAQQGMCISHYNKAIGNYVESGNTTRTGYNLNLSGILATSVNNTEIKDNTIIGRYSGGYGIYCSTNDYGIIARNKICGDSNKLERGINCLNSTRLIIDGNIIQNQLVNFCGISVGGTSSFGTRIINNIIGTCYSQASSGTRSGIVFANISDFTILNNYVDNYVRGIHCNGNSRGIIANNQIVNTTDTSVINTGILCTTSNDTELIYVSDNYVQDFTYREIDKGSNSNAVYVTNKNKKDFYDNTAGVIKTLSINNSNVVVS